MAAGIVKKLDSSNRSYYKVDDIVKLLDVSQSKAYDNLWTSGQVGVGRLYDRNGVPIQDNGKEHVLIISSSYGLDPWTMLETVMLDDEYEVYMDELAADVS